MTRRRPRSLIVLLLLATAFFVSITIIQPPPVRGAVLTVSLNPSKGTPPVAAHGTAVAQAGQTIFFSASGAVVLVGTSCSIVTDNPTLLGSPSISAVKTGGFVTGSFVVGDVPGKGTGNFTYYFGIACGADFGSASTGFIVLPKITLDPSSGTANQTDNVVGAGFRADATLCSINSAAAATSPLSSCSFTGTGKISGQFTVKTGIADGAYNVTVFPNLGYNATAPFNKISGPSIFVSPPSAPPGYGTATGSGVPEPKTITVAGGGFATGSSRSCTLASSGTSALFATSPARTCTISSAGTVTGNFAVANGASPGPYQINVTDSTTGARASFSVFTVLPQPTITLSTSTGSAGTPVNVTIGSNTFSTFDQGACTISSSPTGLISSPTCLINQYGGFFAASFQVSSSAPAQGYTITVTGLHGDFAVAVFTVSPISLTINPSSGSPPLGSLLGTTVTITGSGFSNVDNSCTVTHPNNATNPNIVSSLSCSVTGGSLTATYTVAAGATFGTYNLTVTGTPGFDKRWVFFQVRPRIQLTPSSGGNGTLVSVLGTGFLGGAGPATCASIFSLPSSLVKNSSSTPPSFTTACSLYFNGTVVGSFFVGGATPLGGYTVTVRGATAKDYASATFIVTTRVLTLSPTSGFPGYTGVGGTFVTVTGSGFNASDTSCTISSTPTGLIKALTGICSITNGNVAASFQVADLSLPISPGTYNVFVRGNTGDTGVGVFTVGVVTVSTSTFTSVSSIFTTTPITTTTSTTQVSTSFSTTTLQTTGIKTESFTSFTSTTISGLTTTTTTSTTVFSTTSFVASTTILSTITTIISHTLGQIINASSSEPSIDGFGLFAMLILLVPAIFRRLVK